MATRPLRTFRALAITMIVCVVLSVLVFAQFLHIDLQRAREAMSQSVQLGVAEERNALAQRFERLDGLARDWMHFDASVADMVEVHAAAGSVDDMRVCVWDPALGATQLDRPQQSHGGCERAAIVPIDVERVSLSGAISREVSVDETGRVWIRYRGPRARHVTASPSAVPLLAPLLAYATTDPEVGAGRPRDSEVAAVSPASATAPASATTGGASLSNHTTRGCIELRIGERFVPIGCANAPHATHSLSRDTSADPIDAFDLVEIFETAGLVWRLRLTPDQRALGGEVTSTPFIVLLVCLALGAVICVFVYSITDRSVRLLAQGHRMRSVLVRLERQNRDLNQFAAMAAHDLQAPMRFVVANTHLLLMELEELARPDLEEIGRSLVEQGERMRALVLDLLDYCRANQQPLERVALDPRALIEAEIAVLKADPAYADTTVEIGGLPDTVTFDQNKFIQIVRNLVGNAMKYSCGRESPRIRIAAERGTASTGWLFRVEDNGPGIAAGHRDQVFEPFRRLDTSSTGTGIGLAIVRKLVERHGGQVWIDPDFPEGTAFCFTLNEG